MSNLACNDDSKETIEFRNAEIQRLLLKNVNDINENFKSLQLRLAKNDERDSLEHTELKDTFDKFYREATINPVQKRELFNIRDARAALYKPKSVRRFYSLFWSEVNESCGVTSYAEIPLSKFNTAKNTANNFSPC
jgi:hypothetical protein